MKFITLFTLLLIAFVGYTSAQCRGLPRRPNCIGARDVGRSGRGCMKRTMWYYNNRLRNCAPMNYLGCGGNSNRWCDLATCRRRCM